MSSANQCRLRHPKSSSLRASELRRITCDAGYGVIRQ